MVTKGYCCLSSGYSLVDPNSLSKRIHKLIKLGLNIDEEQDELDDIEAEVAKLDTDAKLGKTNKAQIDIEEESTMEEVD